MTWRGPRALICLTAVAVSLAFSAEAGAAPNNFFGVSSVSDPTTAQLQRIAAGGARASRVELYWGAVEPTPGARRWNAFDAVVADAARTGVTILPVLFGTPSWVSPNPASPPIYTAQGRSAWATFILDLTLRYGTNGSFWALHPELPRTPITTWQIWNEVNLPAFWGGKPNTRGYVDLLRLTREPLLRGDPAAKVVLAGLIPFKTTAPGSVGGEKYLQRLMKVKGIRKLFEAVAIHPYGKSPSIVLKALLQTRELLNALGARRIPLWVTEFGWSTGGVAWSSSPFRATPATQATRVRQSYGLLLKNRKRLRLKRAFYFSLADFDQPNIEDDWSARMGLFDLNGQPKPAWYAYVRRAGGLP